MNNKDVYVNHVELYFKVRFKVYSLVSRFPRFTRLCNLPVTLPNILNKPTVTTRFLHAGACQVASCG